MDSVSAGKSGYCLPKLNIVGNPAFIVFKNNPVNIHFLAQRLGGGFILYEPGINERARCGMNQSLIQIDNKR